MVKGYIYIMTNPSWNGKIRIGYSTDVEAKRKKLSNAVPFDYEIYATYETTGEIDDKKICRLLGNLIPNFLKKQEKGFFEMTPEDAYKILETIALISGTQKKLKIGKPTNMEQVKTVKREPFNFAKCGIPIGAELVYKDDTTIKVTVADNRRVLYNQECLSMSALVKQIKGGSAYDGPDYFTYNGEPLLDIAERTQRKNG